MSAALLVLVGQVLCQRCHAVPTTDCSPGPSVCADCDCIAYEQDEQAFAQAELVEARWAAEDARRQLEVMAIGTVRTA